MIKHSQLKTLATAMVALHLVGASAWAQGVPETSPDDTDDTRMTAPTDTTRDDSLAPSTTDPSDTTERTDMDAATSDSVDADTDRSDGSLPATATPLWLLGLLSGAGLLGVATALRAFRLRRRA